MFFNEFSFLTLEKIITLLCNYYQKGSSAARFQWFSVKFVTLATWPGGLASPFSWNRSWDEMIPSNIEIQLFAKISRFFFDRIKISKEINSGLIEIAFLHFELCQNKFIERKMLLLRIFSENLLDLIIVEGFSKELVEGKTWIARSMRAFIFILVEI